MQITVETKALTESLLFLSSSLVNNPEFPVLSNIHFKCDSKNQRVVLTTSNIETSVISQCAAVFDEDKPLDFLIPAKQFISIISNSSADQTILKFSETTYAIRYSLDQTSGRIKCLAADDYPIPIFGETDSIKIKAHELWEMITKTIIACDSSDSNRVVLTGIHLSVTGDVFQMISGDGYRVALFRHNLDAPQKEMHGVIPSKYLKPLRSILRKFDDDQEVKILIGTDHNGKIIFEMGNTAYVTQVLSDPFPDVSGIFNLVFDKALQISVPALVESINMHASYAIDSDGSTYFKSNQNSQYCMVSASKENGAIGTVIANLDGSITFPDICFNIKFLSDFTKVCGDDTVFVYLNTGGTPIFLRPASDVALDVQKTALGYSYYIMPIGDPVVVSDQEYDFQAIEKLQQPNEINQKQIDPMQAISGSINIVSDDQIESDSEEGYPGIRRFVEGVTGVVDEDHPF
jgi:DNA polymerase III beta subunit